MKSLNDQILVFDNKLNNCQLTDLYFYCLRSKYTLQQGTEPFYPGRDTSFSCHLSKEEFVSIKVLDTLSNLFKELDISVYFVHFYINHYSQFSYVHRHIDSAEENDITILFFCNKYWEESWGGELKIYEDSGMFHKVIDFIPGRIVIFDSRIQHKVLPLTPDAKMDRFTLAIKGTSNPKSFSQDALNSCIRVPF